MTTMHATTPLLRALLASALLAGCSGSERDGAQTARDAGHDGSPGPDAGGGPPDADLPDAAAPDASTMDAGARPVPLCTSVAHIGDSLTAYTIAPLTQTYEAAGYQTRIDAYGGRAILEKLPEDPATGKKAALNIVRSGFRGCWVVALGTNDTANVAAGANHTRGDSIDAMMEAIDPSKTARVMWVNTFTEKDSGYWKNANMILWNEALVEAQTRWPNIWIFDWAAQAQTGVAPFTDGIHHTEAGAAVRNAAIVEALDGFSKPK